MAFCDRLKELRIEKGFTQRELSAKLQLSPNIICEWEKKRCEPSIDTLKGLSTILECTVDYLVDNTDDLGNITVYQQTDGINSLTAEEQKIIDVLRRNTSINAGDFLTMYAELPTYMQESIFAELKGMHLGYTVSKKKKQKENV